MLRVALKATLFFIFISVKSTFIFTSILCFDLATTTSVIINVTINNINVVTPSPPTSFCRDFRGISM